MSKYDSVDIDDPLDPYIGKMYEFNADYLPFPTMVIITKKMKWKAFENEYVYEMYYQVSQKYEPILESGVKLKLQLGELKEI